MKDKIDHKEAKEKYKNEDRIYFTNENGVDMVLPESLYKQYEKEHLDALIKAYNQKKPTEK